MILLVLCLKYLPQTWLEKIKSVTSLFSFGKEDRSTLWCINFFKLQTASYTSLLLECSALQKMFQAEMTFIYIIIIRPFLFASFGKEVQCVCSPSVWHNREHVGNLPAFKLLVPQDIHWYTDPEWKDTYFLRLPISALLLTRGLMQHILNHDVSILKHQISAGKSSE